MLKNIERRNVFNFDNIDLMNLQNYNTSENKGTNSPTSLPFIKNEKKQISPSKPIKKNKIFKFIKFIIMIILFVYLIKFFNFDDIKPYEIKRDNYYQEILNEIPNENNEIFKLSEFGITKTFLSQTIINKFNSYIELCINNKLIDKKKHSLFLNPKISIIMPIYKGGKYLYYSLRSIQNQKMKEIEIILIDDNSPDDTLLIIDKYMKEDPRIKLIKNDKNRKVLYSKSIGALNAKGKYIMQLDQDDIFIRDDVFDILFSEIENKNLDLVQIRDITKNNFHFNKKSIVNCGGKHYIYPKNNQFKEQPDLKETLYINNNIFLLWGLLIRADIYKQAIYKLWNIIINYQIIFHEDYMITFMIVILSKNYKYINKFALIHLNHIKSASSNHWNIKEYYLSILFFANILYDYHIKNNPKDIILGINFIKLSLSCFKKGKELFPNMFNLFIEKVLKNNYLSKKDELFIKNEFEIDKNNISILNEEEYYLIETFQKLKNINTNKALDNNVLNDIKISIIIICDEFIYLEKTINTIENQNFSNFEIIIIYDNDDAYNMNLIKKYIKIFSNIKLIRNKEKKGYLFSISKGILSSNGKYILVLEPGYTLAKDNILKEIYSEITTSDVDILEFNLLINNNNDNNISINSISLYKCEHFISKIREELNILKYTKNMSEIDQEKDLLSNKLIKANIIKNIINEYKLMEYIKKIYNYYNDIILFLLSKKNISFKHIDNYGVIQNFNNIVNLNHYKFMNKNSQKSKDSVFYINFLYEKSRNTKEEKEKVFNIYNNMLSLIFNKFNKISKKSQKLYEKFLNCKYISSSNKNLLKLYYHSLIN